MNLLMVTTPLITNILGKAELLVEAAVQDFSWNTWNNSKHFSQSILEIFTPRASLDADFHLGNILFAIVTNRGH